MKLRRRKKYVLWVLVKWRKPIPLFCGWVFARNRKEAEQLFLGEFGILFDSQEIRRVNLEN